MSKPSGTRKQTTIYSVHPGVEMVQKWIADLPSKSGRSLDEWLEVIRTKGPRTERERRDWLKAVHGHGTNSAGWLVDRAEGKGAEDGDPELYLQAAEGYVREMFAGNKADLKPLYDALLALGLSIAKDVKACPCKTIVPLYRNHVFAQIKPSTRTRIDLGFALKDAPATGRLIDTGGFAKKDRITHRIPISAIADINDEVRQWLKAAYDLDT